MHPNSLTNLTQYGRRKGRRPQLDVTIERETLDAIDRYATSHDMPLAKAGGHLLDRAMQLLNIDAID